MAKHKTISGEFKPEALQPAVAGEKPAAGIARKLTRESR
jgi:hypothetical protein